MPTDAFIYSDAMTESKGDTPKEGVTRQSKQQKSIKNRLFACEVICGPVNLMLYISVDNTIAGGANIAIEIQRVGLEYLAKELEVRGLRMPRTLHFQFDNCGENKVCNFSMHDLQRIANSLYVLLLNCLHSRTRRCSAMHPCLLKQEWSMK